MNQPTPPQVTVDVLTSYTEQDAIDIGKLLPYLSNRFGNDPIPESILRDIISSPYHEQLVARDSSGTIVGTLTISLTMGVGVVRKAWLEDFIVDPAMQGTGIGGRLWDALLDWCHAHAIHKLDFTSHPNKRAAQHFYLKRGATIRDTNYFRKTID